MIVNGWFQCDNLEWENFLKEFMQPLSNDTADADEEDDPEYKVVVGEEEEELDREELRRDRAVTVSAAELRTLMMELLGDANGDAATADTHHSSDDETKVIQNLEMQKFLGGRVKLGVDKKKGFRIEGGGKIC